MFVAGLHRVTVGLCTRTVLRVLLDSDTHHRTRYDLAHQETATATVVAGAVLRAVDVVNVAKARNIFSFTVIFKFLVNVAGRRASEDAYNFTFGCAESSLGFIELTTLNQMLEHTQLSTVRVGLRVFYKWYWAQ